MNIKDIKPVEAKKPKTKESQKVALLLGVILLIMSLTQLIFMSGMIGALYSVTPGITYHDASALAATIITLELLSLPFLFRLKLTHGLRSVSMVAGWLVLLMWLLVSIWASAVSSVNGIIQPIGVFGNLVPAMSGFIAIIFVLMLSVSMAWASWGLWPLDVFRPKLIFRKKNKK